MIDLNDVIEAIEFENESLSHYYNKETGIIIYIETDENWKYKNIETIDGLEEWEIELFNNVKDFKENKEKYISLPSIEELNEEDMMKEFLASIGDKSNVEGLDIRKIKEKIENLGELTNWFDYRENREEKIAKDWCNKNNIEFK